MEGSDTGGPGRQNLLNGCFSSRRRVCGRKWHRRPWTSEPAERLFLVEEEGLWKEVTQEALDVRTC